MENQESSPNQAQPNQAQQPLFAIEKIYIKDLSVEVPNAPQIFLEQGAPQVEIQLNSQANALGEGLYNVVLTITVTAKLNDKTLFLVEAGQAGIFRIVNVPEQELEPLLAIACPNILQAYVREAISSATANAGFQPVILQPINFEALYVAKLQEKAKAEPPALTQ